MNIQTAVSAFKPISFASYQVYLAECWDLGVGALTFEQWNEALSGVRQQVAAMRRELCAA